MLMFTVLVNLIFPFVENLFYWRTVEVLLHYKVTFLPQKHTSLEKLEPCANGDLTVPHAIPSYDSSVNYLSTAANYD